MQVKETIEEFHERADKVREIAQGVFDKGERRFILRFVSDCEKIAAISGPRAH
jgi:hypothetical protein